MEEFYCPVKLTADIIGGKWKPLILFYLEDGTKRFGELRRADPRPEPKKCSRNICGRELERDQVVHRKVYAVVPPKVEYSLTRHGESLKPILKLMSAWGTRAPVPGTESRKLRAALRRLPRPSSGSRHL